MQVAVLVNGKSSVTIKDMTIDGNNLGANAVLFWNSSSGLVQNLKILNPAPFTGIQTGQALAIDATAPGSVTLNVNQCEFLQWNKNAIDAVNGNSLTTGGGALSVNVNGGTITGRGPQSSNAQNGILLWARAGGNVTGTINGTTISGVQYTPTHESCAILLLSAQPSTVSNSTFTNVDQYITNYYPGIGDYSGAVDATTNNLFDGISPASSSTTINQLGAIEDKIGHKMDDFNGNLVTFLTNNVVATVNNLGIQNGINAATGGWTVNVASGAYTENLNLTKNLTIVGQPPTGGTRPVITGLITKDASLSAFNGMLLENLVFSNTGALLDFAAGTIISGSGLVFQGTDFNFTGTSTPTGPSGYLAPLTFVSLNISGTTGLKFINSSLSISGLHPLNGLYSLVWMQATGGPILFDGVTVSGNYTDGGTLMGAQFNLGTASTNVELKNSSTSSGGNFYLSGITGLSVHNNTFSNAGMGLNNVENATVTNNTFQDIDQTYKCGGGGTPSVLTNRVIQMEAAWGDANSHLKNISIHDNTFSNINNVHSVWVTRYNSADPTSTTFSNVHVNQNDFSGANGIVAASDYATAVLDATCNWWGTTNTLTIATEVTANVNFIPFLIAAPPGGACTGAPSPTTTIQNPTSISCNSYDVDVKVLGFTEVGAISLVLNYDPLVFSYQGVTLNAAIASAISGNNLFIGQFTLGEYPVPAVTLPDNAVLFTLHFTLLPHSSGTTTAITWSTSPGDCQYAGPGGTPVYVSTFNNLTPLWTIPVRPVVNTTTLREYCTIQAAINDPATLAGHTITVAAGTYDERITISKQLTLHGATWGTSKNGFIIPSAYAYDPLTQSIIKPSTDAGDIAVVQITADKVIFDGFIVANEVCLTGGSQRDLIAIPQGFDAPTGIQILNNVLGPNTNMALQDGTMGRCGLTVYGPHANVLKLIVKNNKIFDSKGNGAGIMIVGPYGPTYHGGTSYVNLFHGSVIDNNEITGNHRSGIELAGGVQGGTATSDYFMITNNIIINNGWYGVSDKDNLKYGNGIGLIRGGSDRGYADANSCQYISFTGNQISGNEKNGIYMGPKNENLFFNNNFIQNNGLGTGEYSLWDGVRVDLDESYYPSGTTYPDYTFLTNTPFNQNSLTGNGTYAVNVIKTPTQGPVIATCNWWGTNTVSGVTALINGLVTYSPWLINSSNIGSPPGFYPGGCAPGQQICMLTMVFMMAVIYIPMQLAMMPTRELLTYPSLP